MRVEFIIICIVLYFAGRKACGEWLVKEDEPLHADAIVMLMGSIADRVLQVSDLYTSGYASEVILVETMSAQKQNILVERGISILSNTDQSGNALLSLNIPADSIIVLQGGALSTSSEALIIRDYIKDHPQMDTLLLVTSADHARRASMIFDIVMEDFEPEIQIFSVPSSYTKFQPDAWWKEKEDIQVVLEEYIKLLNFLCFEKRRIKRDMFKEKKLSLI